MEVTQDIIDALIVQVKDAETAGAISNEMVGTILDWINTIQKAVAEVPGDLEKEINSRELGDAGIRTSLTILQNKVQNLETVSKGNSSTISTLLGNNANDTIESFNEIIKFLEGIKDSERLVSKLNAIDRRIDDDGIQIASIEEKAEDALEFAKSAARTAAATSEAVNTVNSHTGIINNIRDKVTALEGARHFEEVESEEELQARLVAGTLESDKLYFVAEHD